mmetsp:Transcript_20094/g.35718  ORF Transcript_20094/g.35718 Transcript_20094/m.35718 type:complete len:198 (+) Transcript_20094:41-634(+)
MFIPMIRRKALPQLALQAALRSNPSKQALHVRALASKAGDATSAIPGTRRSSSPGANVAHGSGWSIPEGNARSDGWAQDKLSSAKSSKAHVSKCIDGLVEGFEALKANGNEDMILEVNRSEPEVDVTFPAFGNFRFISSEDSPGEIAMVSPVSGVNSYAFSETRGRWIALDDGHDMEGILTRDLLRCAAGVPSFRLV